jgi:hypothetical protein
VTDRPLQYDIEEHARRIGLARAPPPHRANANRRQRLDRGTRLDPITFQRPWPINEVG